MNYLFDLDGLLINSEELYYKANWRFFKEKGMELAVEEYRKIIGKRYEEWVESLGITGVTGREIQVATDKIFFEMAEHELKLMPGVEEVMNYCRAMGKTALITSSNSEEVRNIFNLLPIEGWFSEIITGEDVTNAKPNPEGYLLAAKRLGVKTSECVVFEDAPNGVEAGKRAGCKVVAVPSFLVKGENGFLTADYCVDSIEKSLYYLLNSCF